MIIASSGTKLSVASRSPAMEDDAITTGEYYEANYDITGELSRAQAIELIRGVRRKSLDYADAVLFQYAEVSSGSPQMLKFQFKALKSTRSPFVITAAVVLTGIILAAKAALILGAVYLTLKALDRITTGITSPFTPTITTTYTDPETGDEYGTIEEYEYAWSQRHPGTVPPPPGVAEKKAYSMIGMIAGLAVIIAVAFIVYYLWVRVKK